MPSGRSQGKPHDDGRENQPPIGSDEGEPVLQGDKNNGTPERPQKLVHATQNRHQQRIARMLPAEIIGIGALQQERQQPARQPHHRAAKAKAASLICAVL